LFDIPAAPVETIPRLSFAAAFLLKFSALRCEGAIGSDRAEKNAPLSCLLAAGESAGAIARASLCSARAPRSSPISASSSAASSPWSGARDGRRCGGGGGGIDLVEPREKNQLPARTAGRVPTAQRRDADRSPRARPPLSSRRVDHGVVRARRVRVRVLFAARVAAAVLAPPRADARAPSPNASAFDEREG
jgi:hypothetical protein